jgi:hypothetical protein
MKHVVTAASTAIAASLLSLASAAQAFPFLFIIPIPKGSANPDGMEATLLQRQNAMCAAYNLTAIDTSLSGKRETTWRGKVAAAAQANVADFQSFVELRNRYTRQWQLQSKNSYQAGMDYSNNLLAACQAVNLPTAPEQYELWKSGGQISTAGTGGLQQPVTGQRVTYARPLNRDAWVNQAALPKLPKGTQIKATEVEVQITQGGLVDYCDVIKTSGVPMLDMQACSGIKDNGRFVPKNEGRGPVSSVQTYVIEWPEIYASIAKAGNSSATSVVPRSALSSPPTQEVASLERAGEPSQPTTTTSSDPVMDKALRRCDLIGDARGSPGFKSCVEKQLELLSR